MKKISIIFILGIIVWLFSCSKQEEVSQKEASQLVSNLTPIVSNGKWGYRDKDGNITIKPQFYWAWSFSDGLACVVKEEVGEYGYIDEKGKMVIKPQFNWADNFSSGIAWVEKSNKWFYIDKTGKEADKKNLDTSNVSFEEYVKGFSVKPLAGHAVPTIVVLPQKAYESALKLSRENKKHFEKLVCLYLLKYSRYYVEYFHQSYDFLVYDEVKSGVIYQDGNTKYYLLKNFIDFSKHKIGREGLCTSAVIYDYSKQHFRDYNPIKAELDAIDSAYEEVEKALRQRNGK